MERYVSVPVDPDLMMELLNAAKRTALSHRNQPNEQFVLGQMEATANAIYVMIVSQGFDQLEEACERLAHEALNRLAEINFKVPRANVPTLVKRA